MSSNSSSPEKCPLSSSPLNRNIRHSSDFFRALLLQFLFQLVIGCQNARKKSPERRILRLSGEEESGHFSGEDELEDTTHHNNARGKLMQKPETDTNSRAGSSSGHSSGHMSHRNEITSGTYTIFNTYSVG